MKASITVLLIIATLCTGMLLSGCFTAVARSGEGWSGAPTSASTKVAAGVADVVSAPVQAPLLGIAAIYEARRKAIQAKAEERLKKVRENPDYIFEHKLHIGDYYGEKEVVIRALTDHSIKFTDAQLRRLYREMDWSRAVVLENPHCSIEVLSEVWNPIHLSSAQPDSAMMVHLVRNPLVPSEWLQVIALDKVKYSYASNSAEYFLKERAKAVRVN